MFGPAKEGFSLGGYSRSTAKGCKTDLGKVSERPGRPTRVRFYLGALAHLGACLLATNTENTRIVMLLTPMTREERAEVERLCRLIQDEKDNDKFVNLIYQLNSLFEGKKRRINGDLPGDR